MKKYAKLILACALIAVFSVVLLTACGKKDDNISDANLVKNGDFESLGLSNWTEEQVSTTTYLNEVQETSVQSDQYQPQFGRGTLYLYTTNLSAGYIHNKQVVSLDKSKTYVLELDVNVSNIASTSNFVGAVVGFVEDKVDSRIEINSETDGWTHRTLYFSPRESGDYTFYIGIGNENNKVMGAVYYDNISIKECAASAVPAAVEVAAIGTVTRNGIGNTAAGNVYVILLGVFALLFAICMYFTFKRSISVGNEQLNERLSSKPAFVQKVFGSTTFYLILSVLLGFAIRFVLVNTVKGGYSADMTAIANYGSYILKNKISKFYTNYGASAMSVGGLYFLTAISYIAKLLGVATTDGGFIILYKVPAILAELILIWQIYNLVAARYNRISAFISAVFFALMPALFTFSGAYGELFSVAILLQVYAFLVFFDKEPKIVLSLILNSLAVLLEPIMVIPAIMLVYAIVLYYISNRSNGLAIRIFVTLAVCGIAMFASAMTFAYSEMFGAGGSFVYPVSQFISYIEGGQYQFSYNTFNMYMLFGKSAVVGQDYMSILNFLFVLVMFVVAGYFYISNTNRLNLLLHSAVILAMFAVFGVGAKIYYLAIAIVLLAVYNTYVDDKRIYLIELLYGITVFVNAAGLMNLCGNFGSGSTVIEANFAGNNALAIVFSVINILTTLYFAYVYVKIAYMDSLSLTLEIDIPFKEYCAKVFGAMKDKRKIAKNAEK